MYVLSDEAALHVQPSCGSLVMFLYGLFVYVHVYVFVYVYTHACNGDLTHDVIACVQRPTKKNITYSMHAHAHIHNMKIHVHEVSDSRMYASTTNAYIPSTHQQVAVNPTRAIWIISPSACTHIMGKPFASIWSQRESNPQTLQPGAFSCFVWFAMFYFLFSSSMRVEPSEVAIRCFLSHFGAVMRKNPTMFGFTWTVWFEMVIRIIWVCAGMEHMAILRASTFQIVKEM